MAVCRDTTETCYGHANRFRVLTPWSKCSLPDSVFKMCDKQRDQMNCTFSTISPLTCNVNGYPTTISLHVICKNFALCDDRLDDVCIEAEFHCKIHKHQLCDGIGDCNNRHDESKFFCEDLVPTEIGCVRRLSYNKSATKIPRQWILDGVVDCMNSIDEDPTAWATECGSGTGVTHSFTGKSDALNCSLITQLKCPKSESRLNLDRVCSGISNNCDSQLCVAARKEYEVISQVKTRQNKSLTLLYCLQGLSNLENHAGKCSYTRLTYQTRVAGIEDSYVTTSKVYTKSYIDCRHMFGEYLVYVSCAGHCNFAAACPLKPLKASNCLNFPKHRLVFSLAEDDTLSIAVDDGKRYSKEYFACQNGVCVEFDKVCNLEDDCKDQSDEEDCINNFKCKSGEFIPLSKKCDRVFDCFDISDECNEECDNQVKMFNYSILLLVAWVLGAGSTILNIFALTHGLVKTTKLKKDKALINNCFVLMIAVGDLLQGLFLLMLAIVDSFFNKSTCQTQFEWTTSKLCVALGGLSTIGSLVSLYSMTILSIFRASNIRSLIPPADGL